MFSLLALFPRIVPAQLEERDILQPLEAFWRARGEALENPASTERQQLVRSLVEEVKVVGKELT